MQISPVNNTNFQARNQTIRFADDLARLVNRCYPRISLTKIASYKNASYFPELLEYLADKIKVFVRKERNELYDDSYSFLDKIKSFIKPVKKNKLGNCAESAHLSAIAAKVNGIKDCHLAHLYNTEGEDFDHTVVFVKGEKPYIIDAWLGFADYVPNTIERFKNEYNYIFKTKPDEQLTFVSYTDDEYTYFLKDNFTRSQINKLRRIYPEMFIKRGFV